MKQYDIVTLTEEDLREHDLKVPSEEKMGELAAELRKYYDETFGEVLTDLARSVGIKTTT